ncbi:MAG: AI-2E family transporter [Proteobacteria bacterium]|nr:AI-2E family transporter [Pseudomonadota bacterium]
MNSGNPDSSAPGSGLPDNGSLRDRALGIIAFAAVLAVLRFGRGVLTPLAVALMLSLLLAPLVRRLRRAGLAHAPSVLAAVGILVLIIAGAAGVLGSQVVHMAASLPRYEGTIRQKLRDLDDLTVGRLDTLTRQASRLIDSRPATGAAGASDARPAAATDAGSPLPVEVHQPLSSPLQTIARVLGSLWAPAASSGIVLVVLVFALLEQEGLRDRFIRVAGGTNIRMTTLALNDAATRLSRFFVSQLTVNLGLGAAVALGLTFLGVPQAILWGALSAVLRFVPYVGVWVAAVLATTLAFAVVPGWSLAISTLGLFILVEVLASQVVEPNLYGHATGLSPLTVVVAAIFWGALWGPVGLVLSTPLTLCLLVIGRHTRALNFLDLLLGDAQALTLPQKFYQRALSGDADEIIAVARAFLRRKSFAAYCDTVLMPALHLAFLDREAGAISHEQQIRMRNLLVAVVSTLSGEPRRLRLPPPSVLDEQNAGLILRQHREQLTGRWQGPVAVPPGSVLLCLGLGASADTIAAELLVRALRDQGLDARHVSIGEFEPDRGPPDVERAAVAIVYLVSAFPSPERDRCGTLAGRVRERLAGARLAAVFLPGMALDPTIVPEATHADGVVTSFVSAVEVCLERRDLQAG